MKQIVPIEKQGKKAQRQFYARQRSSWNGINPVTKTVPNKKAYNRKKDKIEARSASKNYGC